jgi:hypothetical protein
MSHILRKVALYVLLAFIVVPAVALTWLRWESGRPQDDRFRERHGSLTEVSVTESITQNGQASEFVTLRSDSGLAVSLRTIRDASNHDRLPVLVVLGGHRTGSDAVKLFGQVGNTVGFHHDTTRGQGAYDALELARILGPVISIQDGYYFTLT